MDYSAAGESTTIGKAGCGPTCAAMIIASIKAPLINPIHTSQWSLEHGYKALKQGTYHSYFVPQFDAYAVLSTRLNSSNNYGNKNNTVAQLVMAELKKGNWVVACMGPGIWTSSGHYIVVYGCDDDGYVYINDPASSRASRAKNTFANLVDQGKYYWSVTVPAELGLGNPYPRPTRTIKYTSSLTVKEDAKWVQWELNRLGYTILIDGKFGHNSSVALGLAQDKLGLEKDFKCGPITREALLGYVVTEEAVPEEIIPEVVVPEVVIVSSNPYPKPTRTIKYTSSSRVREDAKWVQWELNRMGYNILIDGWFGHNSSVALGKAQVKLGLEKDFKCGPITREALLNYAA
jgi:hypothetical protein